MKLNDGSRSLSSNQLRAILGLLDESMVGWIIYNEIRWTGEVIVPPPSSERSYVCARTMTRYLITRLLYLVWSSHRAT